MSRQWVDTNGYGEAESNRYVAKTMVFASAVLFVTCGLNELGLYHVNVTAMRYVTLAMIAISVFMYAFVNTYNHANMSATKYILLLGTAVMTLCDTTVLGIFATPFQVYPLVAGTHYKSKRVNAFAILGAAVAAILSPYIGITRGLWDANFFIWLINLMMPGFIATETVVAQIGEVAYVGTDGIFTFIAIPTFLNVIILGTLSMTVNISRRRRHEQEIANILKMRDKVLYSMADIIENRDFSTGGHVKRTSTLVAIMTKHLKEHPVEDGLDNSFYEALIKGAPLHDVGKITISDIILCKPGKLTDEEFDKIKTHPSESGRMIEQLLAGIEDEERLDIIKRMAKYHHEKYDGSGYPEGLKGDAIPLEARVMAIADVYDALVSERCYKKPMSHDEAYNTIIISMGRHFDPKLEECFKLSYEEFVNYYEK